MDLLRGRNTIAIVVLIFVPYVCQSQSLVARIVPEKNTFLLGEPIYLILEVENAGQQTVAIDSRFGYPCGFDTIEILGFKQKIPGIQFGESCFGGYAGSCGSSLLELKPGKALIQRILLNLLFSLDHPGSYEVRGKRRIPVFANTTYPISTLEAEANFAIAVRLGNENQLKEAFGKYVQELDRADESIQFNAVQAITATAPRFLEHVILRIADMPNWAATATAALGRLNTSRSRQKLVELAMHSDRDATRQAAIFALAKTGDPLVLSILKQITKARPKDDGLLAVTNAGFLGTSAIPFLREKLLAADQNMRLAAIRGLGATASRSAVPVLIRLLNDPQGNLVREARVSLAQLTHYSVGSNLFVNEKQPNEFKRWQEWWNRHGATAEIYDTAHCSQPRMLPIK